mgnify:CR=1 FL=1
MTDRGDGPENKKGNTDKRHEPKDVRHENRLARGDSGMPGPGGHKFSAQSRNLGQEDHGRDQRDLSREHQLGMVMRGDRDNPNVLSDQFRDAKSRTNERPAEKPGNDRTRDR